MSGGSLEEKVTILLRRCKGDGSLTLNSFQRKAISLIEERDDNFLIVAPTGIGKTMIGVAAIVKYGKGFYLAPLRSLMREKYIEFRKMFGNKHRIVLTNKDYSIPRSVIKNADIRILSPYKFMVYMDMLDPDKDGIIVVDEVHMVNEDAEMEAAVTAIKSMGFRIVALSATIHRDDVARMSRWLDAMAVVADEERPVPLKFAELKLQLLPGKVVVEQGAGYFKSGEVFADRYRAVAELVKRIRTRDPGGGILVWAPTRKEADTLAYLISTNIPVSLPGIGKQVITSTEHDKMLRHTLEKGVAIHHGGISSRNRELVEQLFMERKIGVIVSCFTLSHGVNFPVRYLILSSLTNFDGKPLDPSTFHQIAGRAGRPGLDPYGVVVTVTLGDLESFILSKILSEKATRVRSRLYNKWTLTKIAAQRLAFDGTVDGFAKFLRQTYYVQIHGKRGLEELMKLGEEVVETVVEAYFDVEGDRVYPRSRVDAVAAIMGLHPREREVYFPAIQGNYRETVAKAVEAAGESCGVGDREVMEKVLDYGFLAIYLGGWKTREVAEVTQTILDAVAVYTRRLHGWKSNEFSNARKVAETYAYGGNPNAEYLAKVLRHDELKRVIRNVPQVLFADTMSFEAILELVRTVVRLVFEFKRKIYMKRVYKVVNASLITMLGDEIMAKKLLPRAKHVAYEEIKEIVKLYGAMVIK